jgi:hypothetical protein
MYPSFVCVEAAMQGSECSCVRNSSTGHVTFLVLQALCVCLYYCFAFVKLGGN